MPKRPPTAPRHLFDVPLGRLLLYAPLSSFDVSRDGEHIVGTTYESVTPPSPAVVNFVVNWFDELRAKVPVSR